MTFYEKMKAYISYSLLILHSACTLSSGGKNSVVTTCNIPSDQSGTISGRWPTTPIPIAFFNTHFNSSELSDMTAAADTWNTFFNASQSIATVDYGGSSSNPRISTVVNPMLSGGSLCAQGIISGGQFSGNIVVYKRGTWPNSYAQSAIALTSFCTQTAQPFPKIYMAIMEINYQNFFVQGKKLPDLQSIVLHELGHVHGLNHSCETVSKTGTPNCNDPNLNPDYSAASMYPVFSFDAYGNGQIKQQLGTNDQSRANCLY